MITKYFYITLLIIFTITPILAQDETKPEKVVGDKAQTKATEKKPVKKDADPASVKIVDKEDAAEKDQPDDSAPPIRRRIVDAETLKKQRSRVGDVLLKPFRAIAPAVMGRLTQFEENREFELLFGFKTDFPLKPQFGSVIPGSGFGAGFTTSTGDKLSKNIKLVASSFVTFEGYVENKAGLEITPQKFAKNKLKIELTGSQSIRPDEDFYGSGAESTEDNETSYFRRQLGVKLAASYQLNKNIKVGAFTDYTHNDITEGADEEEDVITGRFDRFTLPGLDRDIDLLDTGMFVEFDYRDEPDNPHAGWFTRASFSNVAGFGRKDFGWVNYKFDSRAYVPIGSKRRIIALRMQGNFNDRKAGSNIPFFRLARLGGNETLRGYELGRFQGLNSLHMNVEYRFKVMQGFTNEGFKSVEAIMFTDIGQVYNNYRELGWGNVHATWGGGFQFVTTKSVGLTILYAKSPESGRLIFRAGKTF